MWRVPWAESEEPALAAAWRAAEPFPHLVIDGVLDEAHLAELFAVLEDEPVERYLADLYAFDATAPEPTTEAFAELRDAFGRVLAPALARVTGAQVTHADLRAYAYRVGDYLLPHADHQTELQRRLAYAYYLPSPEPPVGGELELFRVHARGVDSARIIEPRGNRIAIFDVSDVSLHQVREVLAGLRLSLAGWFYS
jgi:Rps23 Pro-64 3,4-dihydroxylase Tpa1-like proline 4-hydroxylase